MHRSKRHGFGRQTTACTCKHEPSGIFDWQETNRVRRWESKAYPGSKTLAASQYLTNRSRPRFAPPNPEPEILIIKSASLDPHHETLFPVPDTCRWVDQEAAQAGGSCLLVYDSFEAAGGRAQGTQLCFDHPSGAVSPDGSGGVLMSAHLFTQDADGFTAFAGSECPSSTTRTAMEATQGQMDGFFSQRPYKCHL